MRKLRPGQDGQLNGSIAMWEQTLPKNGLLERTGGQMPSWYCWENAPLGFFSTYAFDSSFGPPVFWVKHCPVRAKSCVGSGDTGSEGRPWTDQESQAEVGRGHGASGVLGPIAKTWEQSRKEGHAQGGVGPPTSPGEKLLEECKL